MCSGLTFYKGNEPHIQWVCKKMAVITAEATNTDYKLSKDVITTLCCTSSLTHFAAEDLGEHRREQAKLWLQLNSMSHELFPVNVWPPAHQLHHLPLISTSLADQALGGMAYSRPNFMENHGSWCWRMTGPSGNNIHVSHPLLKCPRRMWRDPIEQFPLPGVSFKLRHDPILLHVY